MSYYCICKKINQRTNLVNGTDYTWTRYDANGRALADYSNGASYWEIGGRERSFHGGAEIEGSSPQTGTPSYYLRNHLGSIMATTDASKDIVASYQYTPYGEFLSESTSGNHATFGYTGHRLDRELNHYYAKFRYYNPTTMRWLSRDPLGMVDGPNVYAYVRGNVVHAVDPYGLSSSDSSTVKKTKKVAWLSIISIISGIVGPTCALTALNSRRKYNKMVGLNENTGAFPQGGGNRNKEDAFRHCYVSCDTAKKHSDDCSFLFWTLYEYYASDDEDFDYASNDIGRSCAKCKGQSCKKCCKLAINSHPWRNW